MEGPNVSFSLAKVYLYWTLPPGGWDASKICVIARPSCADLL